MFQKRFRTVLYQINNFHLLGQNHVYLNGRDPEVWLGSDSTTVVIWKQFYTTYLSHTIFNNRPYTPKESSKFEFFNEFERIYRMNEGFGIKNSWSISRLIYKDWCSIIKMMINMITRPVIKLEHPEDLSFFYECRTFLHKKILSVYVRVLDLSSFLPPLLNNVGLKHTFLHTYVRTHTSTYTHTT